MGKLEDSREILESLIPVAAKALGSSHRFKLYLEEDLSHVYRRLGDQNRFLELYMAFHEAFINKTDKANTLVLNIAVRNLKKCLAEGDVDSAKVLSEKIIEHYRNVLGYSGSKQEKVETKIMSVFESA
jgi:hypothetical protein